MSTGQKRKPDYDGTYCSYCDWELKPNDWVAVCRYCGEKGCRFCGTLRDGRYQHKQCTHVFEEVIMNRDRPCSMCGGSGVLEDRNDERCSRCEGSGEEPAPPMNEG